MTLPLFSVPGAPPVPDASGHYLRELLDTAFTDEQLAVITADLSPQLVVAGAGSGKTTVMAARVVHAVAHHGVAPEQVLGLTFTNKAAGELAERVRRCLHRLRIASGHGEEATAGQLDDLPTVATYHSYAATLVRDHALRIGREPGAALMSQGVQWQLAMRVAGRAPGPFQHLNWSTPYVADLIVGLAGELSEHLQTPDDVRRHDAAVRDAIEGLAKVPAAAKELVERSLARGELLSLVEAYHAEKARLELVDFGDQVALACQIVAGAPAVAMGERERFRLVVLDEYQDTGVAQRVLLSTVFGAGHSVAAVGDPNQSIYGWRGASAGNLTRFFEHFAPTAAAPVILPLMTSFRCGGRILDAANAIAGPLEASIVRKGRVAVDIPALRPPDGQELAGSVGVARLDTAEDEAHWLAEQVAGEIASGTPPRQVAVLARRRSDFPRLYQAMTAREIPVEVVGLGGLLAMPEVSDVVAVLAVLADSTANAAAVRVLTGPRWRIGVRDLAALGRRAHFLAQHKLADTGADPSAAESASSDDLPGSLDDEPVGSTGVEQALAAATSSVDPVEVPSLMEAVESPGRAPVFSAEALARFAELTAQQRHLRRLVGQPLVDLVTEVVATTGLDVEVEASDPAVAEARRANLHAFLDVTAAFTGIDGEADLSAYLAYLRAAAENERGFDLGAVSEANTVKLMTVHAAKGLEWDVVAVPGLVGGVFPVEKGRSSWVTGAGVLPFACRGDAADLPALTGYAKADFDAFKEDCRSDSDDEERRLAYVAFTRARRRLLLSGYVWSATRAKPCSVSPFMSELLEASPPAAEVVEWAADPEPEESNPLLAANVADVEWPQPLDAVPLQRRRDAADLVTRAMSGALADVSPTGSADRLAEQWLRDTALILAEARSKRARTLEVVLPRNLTTSQVVALARDEAAFAAALARPVPQRPQAQARRGSRFHAWVEQLYGAASLLDSEDLPGAEDADLSDIELALLQERFLADGWGQRTPVSVEAPFEMVVGGRLLRGRIDAVYRSDEGDGYDVIDYKTGAVPTGQDFAAASLQLSIYRLAWADLAGVDPAQVTAGFLYVRDSLVKRPDRLLSRDELAAILSAENGSQPSG